MERLAGYHAEGTAVRSFVEMPRYVAVRTSKDKKPQQGSVARNDPNPSLSTRERKSIGERLEITFRKKVTGLKSGAQSGGRERRKLNHRSSHHHFGCPLCRGGVE